jgi:hypothetical protein
VKSPLTIGMTAENQWALLYWKRSRLRRVIEFTRFARKEILQIYTNQTNIILKIIERFEKILIDSCPLKMPKA